MRCISIWRTTAGGNMKSLFKHKKVGYNDLVSADQKAKRKKLKLDLITCNFIAIIILFTFTPLGFIHLGFVKLTLLHIPVILASLLLGSKRGTVVASTFAGLSLIINTLSPSLMSFAFSPFIPVYGEEHGSILALFICFIPRLLLGYIPGKFIEIIKFDIDRSRLRVLAYSIIALTVTLLHTTMVMLMMLAFFLPAISNLRAIGREETIWAIALLCYNNGLPEALLAGISIPALFIPLKKILDKVVNKI